MKKFDRLPPELRKREIQEKACTLFAEKGFSAVTMENIVEAVTLSKGGVYRIYPSTAAILSDLMLSGAALRNAWYAGQIRQKAEAGEALTLEFLVKMIGDSLLLYPELSRVYVEFLLEKQRNPQLEALYQGICRDTMEQTQVLIRNSGAEDLLCGEETLRKLLDLMNATILSLHTLGLWEEFRSHRNEIDRAVLTLLREPDRKDNERND